MAGKKAKKVDPFKTKKSRTTKATENDTVSPPPEIAEAIDAFRECQEQAKHFEGESMVHKDKILDFCHEEFSKRAVNGDNKSFKVLGDETMVTYVAMDSSAGLTEEEVDEFAEIYGEGAAEELITRDFRSIRFDDKVLAAHYDEIVEALQVLPEEVLSNLFKPMLMKASPGAVLKAKKYGKTPEKLREMITHLKMKNYVR